MKYLKGRPRLLRPTVGGEQLVHLSSGADENQPGYAIDETIANTATANITVGDTGWCGAAFVFYWMKSGANSAAGTCVAYQTGAGAAAFGLRDEAGDAMDVTISASLSGSTLRLDVTNNTGGDLTFTGRYFYAGV